MTTRLTSAMLVSALVRGANQQGGFATIIAKGDPDAGAILLICMDKGAVTSVCERILSLDGHYHWQRVGPEMDDQRQHWLERRRDRDPDLWLVELDIVDAERFAEEMSLMR